MGTSTDGILFYGIDLGEDGLYETRENWEHEDWDDEFRKRTGTPLYPDETWIEAGKETSAKWGVTLGIHCSYDYSCDYVALIDRNYSAARGYPEILTPEMLTVPDDADEKIKAFCELMGIPYEQPRWHLASLWG